ncbi:MAG: plastocyanin/azurin family copper-binding protein [Dehalococcoidia bacterium]
MSPFPMLARASLALIAVVAMAACGSSGATPERALPSTPAASAMASDANIVDRMSIKGFAFRPDDLVVPAGTTVTWVNDEDSLHTVTSGTPASPTGLFDSGEIDTGVEFPFTFADEGTYPFFCARHDFMKGVVTVTP